MSDYVTSPDGTRIAYNRIGDGPTVVLVGGAMQFRGFDPTTVQMAALLAMSGFTVVNYDRRGRGESTPAAAYSLTKETEDIAALIAATGGRAALYGSSSGGAICLAAAAAGLPVTRLALWEVPLGEEGGTDGAAFLTGLREKIAAGDGAATVEYFMRDMPPEWVDGARQGPGWPVMVGLAPSLEPDSEALAWSQSAPRRDLWAAVTQPTLVLVGEQTIPIFPPAAASIVASLADARMRTIPAAGHSWTPDVMAATLAEFLHP